MRLRRSARSRCSGLSFFSSTPARSASICRAPRLSVFSISSTKVKTSPLRSQPKQYQDWRCGFTWKLGLSSWWKGHRPQKSLFRFVRRTYSWTTLTRSTLALTSAKASSDVWVGTCLLCGAPGDGAGQGGLPIRCVLHKTRVSGQMERSFLRKTHEPAQGARRSIAGLTYRRDVGCLGRTGGAALAGQAEQEERRPRASRRSVVWVKPDPLGAEFAEVTIQRRLLLATGTAIGSAPTGYRLDYQLFTGPGYVTKELFALARGRGWWRRLDLTRSPAGEWRAERNGVGRLNMAGSRSKMSAFEGALDCDLALS